MRKIITLLLLSVGLILPLLAGVAPSREMKGMRKGKTTLSPTSLEAPLAPIAQPEQIATHTEKTDLVKATKTQTAPQTKSVSKGNKASKNVTKIGIGAVKNLFKSAHNLKSSFKQKGSNQFLRIAITIFLFVLFIFLIAMLIGVIFDDIFILFYIALICLLLWTLLFIIGNLGLKKR